MPQTKIRKTHDKPDRHSSTGKRKNQEEVIDILIRGLDALSAMAEESDMGTATRIFYMAKEELVHWAVNMNFHESPQERFINHRLYDNRLSMVEGLLIRAINDAGMHDEILGMLGLLTTVKPRAMAGRK